MQSIYRNIFKQAWDIMWKFKYLWFLGIFSSLIISDGEFGMVIRGFDASSSQTAGLKNIQSLYEQGFFAKLVQNIVDPAIHQPFLIGTLVLLFLLLVCLVVFLVITSQSSLIYAVDTITKTKKSTFKQSLRGGLSFFWRVLLIHITSQFITWFLIITLCAPVVIWLVGRESVSFFASLLLFFIIVPIGVIISFVGKYAMVSAISRGKKFFEAWSEGWKVFLGNWFVSIEMAVILLSIHLIAAVVLVILIGLSVLPFTLLAILSLAFGMTTLAYLFLLVIAVVAIGLLLFFSGGLAAFQFTSWTLLFQQLIKGKVTAKLERLFGSGSKLAPAKK